MKNIFIPRKSYKPFEYPEVNQFINLMNTSFWVHSEVEFTADIQDYKSSLTDHQREIVKRAMLSIAQVEVAVKTFWGDLYKMFPKPEFYNLGATHAESEVRHSEAYSRLLEVLGLDEEFNQLFNVEIFSRRYKMMEDYLNSTDINKSVGKLLFFTLIIENASLFSQFATIFSFTHFKGYLKNMTNIIQWSSVDEQVHALTGIWILRTLLDEGHVTLEELQSEVTHLVPQYMELEEELLDWIFEGGDLEFLSKENLIGYMKYRLNDSLIKIGLKPVFPKEETDLSSMIWYEENVFGNSLDDFFAKRPIDYGKHDTEITGDSLFD